MQKIKPVPKALKDPTNTPTKTKKSKNVSIDAVFEIASSPLPTLQPSSTVNSSGARGGHIQQQFQELQQ